ncbi:MAG: hypothetical protein QM617_07045 [Comamonas sp.]
MAEAQSKIEDLASEAKSKAAAALDETREAVREVTDDIVETATEAGEAVHSNVRQIRARTRVQSAIDQAADRAHELADWSISATFDGVEQARQAYGRYAQETTTYIRRQPVKSVFLAAGIGAIVAGLLLGRSSRRGRH